MDEIFVEEIFRYYVKCDEHMRLRIDGKPSGIKTLYDVAKNLKSLYAYILNVLDHAEALSRKEVRERGDMTMEEYLKKLQATREYLRLNVDIATSVNIASMILTRLEDEIGRNWKLGEMEQTKEKSSKEWADYFEKKSKEMSEK